MHRHTLTSISLVAPAAALLLAACGGGGGSSTTTGGGQGPAVTFGELTLPQMQPRWAGLRPVIRIGGELRVGGAPPPSRGSLAPVSVHGEAAVSHGRVADGVGKATLVDYLQHDAAQQPSPRPAVLYRFESAPTVRYVAGAAVLDRIEGAPRPIQVVAPQPHPRSAVRVDLHYQNGVVCRVEGTERADMAAAGLAERFPRVVDQPEARDEGARLRRRAGER